MPCWSGKPMGSRPPPSQRLRPAPPLPRFTPAHTWTICRSKHVCRSSKPARQQALAQARGRTRQAAAHRRSRPSHHSGRFIGFSGHTLVEVGAEDQLGHDTIGAAGKPVADPSIHIPAADLEIGDGIDVVLLLVERNDIPDRSQSSVVLYPKRQVLTELAVKLCGGREGGIATVAKSDINDRIDDELIVAAAETDDGPDFQIPSSLGKSRRGVAELEIHAIEERALGSVGGYEQLSNLEGIGKELAIAVDRVGGVKP